MKNSLRNIAIGFTAITLLYLAFLFRSHLSGENIIPCQKPLKYHVGSIDQQFDIDDSQLKTLLYTVESIWESPTRKNLMTYSAEKGVAINLIYSKEQQITQSRQKLKRQINQNEEFKSALQTELARLSSLYKNKKKELEQFSSKYNSVMAEYNRTVENWNRRGGIPAKTRKNIHQLQNRIQNMEQNLERMKNNAEQIRKKLTSKYEQVKKLIKRQQDLKSDFNNRFGDKRIFHQGEYVTNGDQKRINIYQFRNYAELKIVLAHETGHALGLTHVENPESIMHKLMGKQDIHNLGLSSQDLSAIQDLCKN